MLRALKFFLLVVISLAFVVFSVVNREPVSVSLFPLPYEAAMPKFLFAMFCFVLGAIVAGLLFSIKLSKSMLIMRREHRRVMALQNQLAGMEQEQEQRLPVVTPDSKVA